MEDDYEPYKTFVSRSIKGNSSSSVPEDYVSREKYDSVIRKAKKRILAFATAAIVTVGVTVPTTVAVVGTPIIKDAAHKYEVTKIQPREAASNLYDEVIYPSMSREGTDQHVEYDYVTIEEKLHDYGDGDYDKNIYLAYLESQKDKFGVNQYDVNRILDCNSKYQKIIDKDGSPVSMSFRNYLYTNNYYENGADMLDDKEYSKAIDNFKDVMTNRMIIEDGFKQTEKKYNEEKAELDEMMRDHNMDGKAETSTKGGK